MYGVKTALWDEEIFLNVIREAVIRDLQSHSNPDTFACHINSIKVFYKSWGQLGPKQPRKPGLSF